MLDLNNIRTQGNNKDKSQRFKWHVKALFFIIFLYPHKNLVRTKSLSRYLTIVNWRYKATVGEAILHITDFPDLPNNPNHSMFYISHLSWDWFFKEKEVY